MQPKFFFAANYQLFLKLWPSKFLQQYSSTKFPSFTLRSTNDITTWECLHVRLYQMKDRIVGPNPRTLVLQPKDFTALKFQMVCGRVIDWKDHRRSELRCMLIRQCYRRNLNGLSFSGCLSSIVFGTNGCRNIP